MERRILKFNGSLIVSFYRTLYELGLPWANTRQSDIFCREEQFPNRKQRSSKITNGKKIKSVVDDFLKPKIGTIVQ
jgi:hypothetical protein